MQKNVVIMGSTGSIGTQTLDVIKRINESTQSFNITALSTCSSIEQMYNQVQEYKPIFLHIADENTLKIAQDIPDFKNSKLVTGDDGWREILETDPDIVVHSIFGRSGLIPLLQAIERGIDIAFAGKEALVSGGPMVMSAVKKSGSKLLPIDSEHNSIFRCIQRLELREIKRLILTASGGPLRKLTKEQKLTITASEASKHPTWNMGARISINSATLVNKGLEMVEATYLFEQPIESIEVLLHPQSIVHGIVQLIDGSMLMHAANTDMRVPISYCLMYPETMKLLDALDLSQDCSLQFSIVDTQAFPSIDLFRAAASLSWIAPAILNVANELWLDDFITGKQTGIFGCFSMLEVAIKLAEEYRSIEPTMENWLSVEQEVIQRFLSTNNNS